MDLFEKIKLIIETQGYNPFDIGNKKPIATGLFLTPNGAMSLHMASLDRPNDHELILPEDTFVYDAKFSPDDSWLVVPIDYSGKELHDLHRIPVGSSKRPVPLEKLSEQPGRTLFLDWSPDGSNIAWAVSRQKTNQVVKQPNKTGKAEYILWSGEEMAFLVQWEHPDYLKLTKADGRTNQYHDVVIDPKTGEIILTLPIAPLNYYKGCWNPKKPIFPYVSLDDGRLSLYDMESNESLQLPEIKGELEVTAWDATGVHLFVSATVDARDTIYSIDVES
ncbi:WD40 repeat domain-containing protein, partial [Candidatus Thorarchaeota archaeon]